MVRLAIADNPLFELSRLDMDRPPPSYTADLLRAMERPEHELFFLVGADILPELHRWREPYEILRLARLVVVNRPGSPLPDIRALEPRCPARETYRPGLYPGRVGVGALSPRPRRRRSAHPLPHATRGGGYIRTQPLSERRADPSPPRALTPAQPLTQDGSAGRLTTNLAPVRSARFSAQPAAVLLGDVPHDGQPEARPPRDRLRPRSSRKKRSKTRSSASGGTPGPSSSTTSNTPVGCRTTCTSTSAAATCRSAFCTRLPINSRSRSSSPCTVTGSASMRTFSAVRVEPRDDHLSGPADPGAAALARAVSSLDPDSASKSRSCTSRVIRSTSSRDSTSTSARSPGGQVAVQQVDDSRVRW